MACSTLCNCPTAENIDPENGFDLVAVSKFTCCGHVRFVFWARLNPRSSAVHAGGRQERKLRAIGACLAEGGQHELKV